MRRREARARTSSVLGCRSAPSAATEVALSARAAEKELGAEASGKAAGRGARRGRKR
jgi:hypothetical protein